VVFTTSLFPPRFDLASKLLDKLTVSGAFVGVMHGVLVCV